MDRFWMYENGDPKLRIQGTVIDIISSNIRHIRVDTPPILNMSYSIVLDDRQNQAEPYALYIMNKFELIDFLFPTMTPEPSAIMISKQIQQFVFNRMIRLDLSLIAFFYS